MPRNISTEDTKASFSERPVSKTRMNAGNGAGNITMTRTETPFVLRSLRISRDSAGIA